MCNQDQQTAGFGTEYKTIATNLPNVDDARAHCHFSTSLSSIDRHVATKLVGHQLLISLSRSLAKKLVSWESIADVGRARTLYVSITCRYTWWWCAAHVVFYFVYMDYMSFATHYHILHGNNWAWFNLHKQHHQIKSR